MRQGWTACVIPSGEPERADVGGGVRDLADENGARLVVKVVVIRVGVRVFSAKRVAVGQKDRFKPAMGAEAGIKGVVGGVTDEGRVVGAHGEKRRVAVDESAAETVVDSGLAAQAAVGIIGGAERVVGLRHIVREDGRIEPGFVPPSSLQRLGQFFAVNANLPGKKAVGVQFYFAKLGDRRFIAARQALKREAPIFVESDEVVALFRRIFCEPIERIGYMLRQDVAVEFKGY